MEFESKYNHLEDFSYVRNKKQSLYIGQSYVANNNVIIVKLTTIVSACCCHFRYIHQMFG